MVFKGDSGSYTYGDFGGSGEDLIVGIIDIDSSGDVWVADVMIYLSNCPPGDVTDNVVDAIEDAFEDAIEDASDKVGDFFFL